MLKIHRDQAQFLPLNRWNEGKPNQVNIMVVCIINLPMHGILLPGKPGCTDPFVSSRCQQKSTSICCRDLDA